MISLHLPIGNPQMSIRIIYTVHVLNVQATRTESHSMNR